MLGRALLALNTFSCAIATGRLNSVAFELFLLAIVLLGK